MPKLIFECPVCHKKAEETRREPFGNFIFQQFSPCGHFVYSKAAIEHKSVESDLFVDGRTLFPFQERTVKFLEDSSFCALVAHEMGLGKTIIALAALKLHPELCPALVLCKSVLSPNWTSEIVRALGLDFVPQRIYNGRTKPFPGFKIYIVSLDLLNSLNVDDWRSIGIKTIIIDEVQLIKSHGAKRTNAVRKFIRELQPQYKIGLSGTPIKNNASEYFPILNILKPERFPEFKRFIWQHCAYNDTGFGPKVRGLRDYKRFKEFTKDFIIRYERKEVMPELPTINRQFRYLDMTGQLLKAYEEIVEEFQQYVRMSTDEHGNPKLDFTNILAYFSRMRHITGLAKIEAVLDFVSDFLLSYSEEGNGKITIFVHHQDVALILREKLKELTLVEPLYLHAGQTPDEKFETIKIFRETDARVMIASTLASGEGLNLQFCHHAVMMERQWNPANEEQAEARFTRIGSTAESVSITYPTAIGTIDEHFASLVEQKRQWVKEALTGQEAQTWIESDLIRGLTEALMKKDGKAWQMPKGN